MEWHYYGNSETENCLKYDAFLTACNAADYPMNGMPLSNLFLRTVGRWQQVWVAFASTILFVTTWFIIFYAKYHNKLIRVSLMRVWYGKPVSIPYLDTNSQEIAGLIQENGSLCTRGCSRYETHFVCSCWKLDEWQFSELLGAQSLTIDIKQQNRVDIESAYLFIICADSRKKQTGLIPNVTLFDVAPVKWSWTRTHFTH